MKPWAIDGEVNGFWWDERRGQLSCKRIGPKAFCCENDLLMLGRHEEGRDVLERKFFGDVDTKGARARDRLVAEGPWSLNHDERCDFARLLLSLEARRPAIVHRLRDDGPQQLVEPIDGDPDIQSEMAKQELSGTASEFLTERGFSFADRALSNIQSLVDDPRVVGRLVKMQWRVKHLDPSDGTLVLSDRPLVRYNGYDHPDAAWVLPLNPKAAFYAVNSPRTLDSMTPQRFAKLLNVDSASYAEKYVFCVDSTHKRLLRKYLVT